MEVGRTLVLSPSTYNRSQPACCLRAALLSWQISYLRLLKTGYQSVSCYTYSTPCTLFLWSKMATSQTSRDSRIQHPRFHRAVLNDNSDCNFHLLVLVATYSSIEEIGGQRPEISSFLGTFHWWHTSSAHIYRDNCKKPTSSLTCLFSDMAACLPQADCTRPFCSKRNREEIL
jgi:hypothetical protein